MESFWKWQLNLRSLKTGKDHGKCHEESWKFKKSKEFEPCDAARYLLRDEDSLTLKKSKYYAWPDS